MRTVYNLLAKTVKGLLPFASGLNEKMRLFVTGRKHSFEQLQNFEESDRIIWFHVASLGEYEQGLPIMNGLKQLYPQHKILLSFFSPSGYENKRNSSVADVVIYLPLDTPENATRFFQHINIELALFVKYDLWPNYLRELKKRKIPAYLISGVFKENSVFFRSYTHWMKDSLKAFEHFFVQDVRSETILKENGFNNVTVTGDTRYDRVNDQLKVDNSLDFAERFKGSGLCLVAGSTWDEDLEILIPIINNNENTCKFIIAPHVIKKENSESLLRRINRPAVLFSEKEGKDLSQFDVLILDTIGVLSQIYFYADLAYVGGAAGKTGLHNILEPATFGVPIIIGKNYRKFPEAISLEKIAGLFSVSNEMQLQTILHKFITDNNFREKTGMIAGHFISENAGATDSILKYFKEHKLLKPLNFKEKT